MSTTNDNPNQLWEGGAACPQPVALPAAGDRGGDSFPRRQKAVLLPEIARRALEGHSSRAIGRELGVPRRTVDRWLREQRKQWAISALESGEELFAVAMARLESVYREAMDAWRRSLDDKQMAVETLGGDGATKANGSLRKTTQAGQAALLGKAIQAAREISKFHAQHLDAACKSQKTERSRVRQDLADELQGLSREAFREVKELVRQDGGAAAGRSTNELAEALRDLTAGEYRKLAATLRTNSDRALPPRRKMEVLE